MRILIVEDEQKVASFLKRGLEENSYEADIAYDGEIALKLAEQYEYNLIIIDIILPGMNGLELCRKFKSINPHIPVLMLTALGTTDDKLSGFEAGADDYLVKPFEFKELLARVKALLKRQSDDYETTGKLIFSDLELDLDKKKARRGGKDIELTAKEFMLLEYFMRNRGRVLSRNDIAAKVWASNYSFNTNVVDVYVNFLRKKIDKGFENKLIHTRVGLGYVFDETK
ncbi:MAG TPA: response regulator transcription factor [Bacteroidales bacterium]|nr:response regulator transcription factor [Bacteroidales bacterium]HCI55423.1 DNA-binding response regulator [Bacteroidales bacterium]HOU96206.1 response regulator transcription factor [Bacteroidales bacterium]HQG36093.1 response regulator transcription factor [Bacteroidales bacterium]HQG52059.1 response regulator transcription factor [Bacteroidales bacterium]